MGQLHYNLLVRWFAGLGIEVPVGGVTAFTRKTVAACVTLRSPPLSSAGPRSWALLSDERFSVMAR